MDLLSTLKIKKKKKTPPEPIPSSAYNLFLFCTDSGERFNPKADLYIGRDMDENIVPNT